MEEGGDLASEPEETPSSADRCLLCRGEATVRYQLPHLWHQSDNSGSYNIRWCHACDFGFLDPRPSAGDLARFLADSRARSRDWPQVNPSAASLAEKIRVRIAWQAAKDPAVKLIDTGLIEDLTGSRPSAICLFGSFGKLAEELERAGHHITVGAADATEATSVSNLGATSFEGTLEAPSATIASSTFDVIVCRGVLERCLDPKIAVANAQRLLKPGGCLIVDLPNHRADSSQRLGPAWIYCDAGNNVNFFTTGSLSRIAEAGGFVVQGLLYWQYTAQFRDTRRLIEQMLWDRLYSTVDRRMSSVPPRNSSWGLWRALATSFFRAADNKFEFAGLIARKPAI